MCFLALYLEPLLDISHSQKVSLLQKLILMIHEMSQLVFQQFRIYGPQNFKFLDTFGPNDF